MLFRELAIFGEFKENVRELGINTVRKNGTK